jgi:hypothetical protein
LKSSYLWKLRECNNAVYKIKLGLQSEQNCTLSRSCSIYQIVIKSWILRAGGMKSVMSMPHGKESSVGKGEAIAVRVQHVATAVR